MMERWLKDITPIMDVEHDCILSRQGDISIVFRAKLPEIFTLSDEDYEALHQALIKAVKVLPKDSILNKQDWFIQEQYQPDFEKEDKSFLRVSSDRFFNERPFLKHDCYFILTKKPSGRKPASSLFSNLLRPSLVSAQTLSASALREFEEAAGQFQRILSDGNILLTRMGDNDLLSGPDRVGFIERYCTLSDDPKHLLVKDIAFKEGFQVGGNYCQLFTLADAVDLPTRCGSRASYEKYSTDKTKFSVGFASQLGLLLACNHIYSQYIFLGDTQTTLKKMESKRLRLQSLAAYSRENAIARDAVNDFLNECISEQRLPVKAHFNVLVWTDSREELKDLRNLVTSALAQMEAAAKEETAGAPQIYWAGIPGNAADFPMNDTFDTFAEQACCFLNLETSYQDSISPVGIRLGDRLTGKPVHVDISDEPVKRGITTNRNKFILGPTGSGKSFFTNHMVRSYYEQGTHVVLVDVGHSYKGLCDLVGGYYFT
jgi:conjugation system TraG family ATPase